MIDPQPEQLAEVLVPAGVEFGFSVRPPRTAFVTRFVSLASEGAFRVVGFFVGAHSYILTDKENTTGGITLEEFLVRLMAHDSIHVANGLSISLQVRNVATAPRTFAGRWVWNLR